MVSDMDWNRCPTSAESAVGVWPAGLTGSLGAVLVGPPLGPGQARSSRLRHFSPVHQIGESALMRYLNPPLERRGTRCRGVLTGCCAGGGGWVTWGVGFALKLSSAAIIALEPS